MTGLAYNPLTGIFTRNGIVAGTVNAQGYVQIKIDNHLYLAQRLAWWIITGEWPENDIDHKNRNKQDNRFINLREATDPENQRNRGRQKNNKSGFKGVSWNTGRKAWLAMIHDGTRNKNLGYFASRENAAIAYDVAALKYHGEFAHLNFGDNKMDIRITHVIELSPALMTLLMSSVSGAALSVPQPDKPVADKPAESTAVAAEPAAAVTSGEVDAGGHPWSADLHASTRGITKDGYWRMKVGVSRPADLPGFPKPGNGGTGTGNDGAAPPASGTAASAGAGPATSAVEDEDEFAAFRAAADKGTATDAAAAASVPARKWTDADLGALCNQAAVKFGDPTPVKAIITEFVPADAVPHSRNIPDDKREAFAKAVEAKAEITFAG